MKVSSNIKFISAFCHDVKKAFTNIKFVYAPAFAECENELSLPKEKGFKPIKSKKVKRNINLKRRALSCVKST